LTGLCVGAVLAARKAKSSANVKKSRIAARSVERSESPCLLSPIVNLMHDRRDAEAHEFACRHMYFIRHGDDLSSAPSGESEPKPVSV
jgi:hypothetical protein